MSGTGIRAFGKLILRGVEIVVIRSRLRELKALFPHMDTAEMDWDRVYGDILELTRCVEFLTCEYAHVGSFHCQTFSIQCPNQEKCPPTDIPSGVDPKYNIPPQVT
jgi:hypothetical protein